MPRDHHKRIQLVTGKNRANKQASVLKDKQGNILIDNNDILSRWREYIGELYEDESRTCESIKFEGTLTGEKIMSDEIRYAIKGMKQNKGMKHPESYHEQNEKDHTRGSKRDAVRLHARQRHKERYICNQTNARTE